MDTHFETRYHAMLSKHPFLFRQSSISRSTEEPFPIFPSISLQNNSILRLFTAKSFPPACRSRYQSHIPPAEAMRSHSMHTHTHTHFSTSFAPILKATRSTHAHTLVNFFPLTNPSASLSERYYHQFLEVLLWETFINVISIFWRWLSLCERAKELLHSHALYSLAISLRCSSILLYFFLSFRRSEWENTNIVVWVKKIVVFMMPRVCLHMQERVNQFIFLLLLSEADLKTHFSSAIFA
jgi:hypothetical protein